ncbi:dUTP diphosphatase [Cytobacillus oceanisediminis]|uniref:dUTP diphosphatase n=1 Tax=Cytobacillus oceanisediminis TaxID=665099 RepID=UPI001FB3B939|nr:dUTP diphosphatase [Cytobacillus oceanisediminis]UOE58184.1 dUTP diphosphatase [Cytobacillus oceanisediminis]
MKNFFIRLFGKRRRGFEVLEEFDRWFEQGYVKTPNRKTHRSAGYDICSIGDYVVPPGSKVAIDTGLTAYMKPNEFLAIVVRSGLAFNHNLTLQNSIAIIDSDYYGNHIRILLRNEGTTPFMVKTGDRIAQGIFLPYLATDNDHTQEREERVGGFGSTGQAA